MSAQYNPSTGRRQQTSREKRYRKLIARRADPCALCSRPIDYELPAGLPGSYELDHIIPIARGGASTIDNFQPTHRACNRAKSDRTMHEYEQQQRDDRAQVARDARRAPSTGEPDLSRKSRCPSTGHCERCHGIHEPLPGEISFITTRSWTA